MDANSSLWFWTRVFDVSFQFHLWLCHSKRRRRLGCHSQHSKPFVYSRLISAFLCCSPRHLSCPPFDLILYSMEEFLRSIFTRQLSLCKHKISTRAIHVDITQTTSQFPQKFKIIKQILKYDAVNSGNWLGLNEWNTLHYQGLKDYKERKSELL